MKKLPSGVYVITDEKLIKRKNFIRKISEVTAAGAGLIQLREKASSLPDRLGLAKEAVRVAHKHGAKLLINDDPALAAAVGADGVHIGKDDASVDDARALLGYKAIIGVSCYGDINLALKMEKAGADYVSFGACFHSPTKPEEPLVSLSIFIQARTRLRLPLVAIGGITPENATEVYKSGADIVSVVSSVFAGANAGNVVKQLKRRKQ